MLKITVFIYFIFFSLVVFAQKSDETTAIEEEEVIYGSMFLYEHKKVVNLYEKNKGRPYASKVVASYRVFVRTYGCTDKDSFRVRVDAVKPLDTKLYPEFKAYGYDGAVLPQYMVELKLIRIKYDGCLMGAMVEAIDFSRKEIDDLVINQTGGRDRIVLLKWNNYQREVNPRKVISPLQEPLTYDAFWY